MAIVISPVVAEALRKVAGGRDVEEFLAELIAERLDPPPRKGLSSIYVSLRNFSKRPRSSMRGATLCRLGRSTGRL